MRMTRMITTSTPMMPTLLLPDGVDEPAAPRPDAQEHAARDIAGAHNIEPVTMQPSDPPESPRPRRNR